MSRTFALLMLSLVTSSRLWADYDPLLTADAKTERRNPNHHRAMLAVTTAFWDAYLRDDKEARQWLDSDAVRSVFEKDDQWQKKVKRSHCKLPKSTLSLMALLVSMLPEADVRAQVPGERPPANILRLAKPALDFARGLFCIGENRSWRDALNVNLSASGKNGAPTPGFAILTVLEGILKQEPKP